MNIGDKVKTTYGGPELTVEHVDGDRITCVWFNDHKGHERALFSFGLLTTKPVPYTGPSMHQPRATKTSDGT
jgi:uncharacterized protein YodC (DUF2158 family)